MSPEPKPTWDVDTIALPEEAISSEAVVRFNIGVGDDVFMLGRFISHSGNQQNQPLARFGNIAMMPGELVTDGRGLKVEAYLVEMRSLSGFSGSPVFIHIGPGSYRGNGTMVPFYQEHVALIGIDTGHKTATAPVMDGSQPSKFRAEINTGIAIVAPVSKILDLLDYSDAAPKP